MKTKVEGRELSLGADVEGVLHHARVGAYIPCTHFNTPWTKENRYTDKDTGRSYHRDNILLEFQTVPQDSIETFVAEVRASAQWMTRTIKDRIPNTSIRYLPIVRFKETAMVEIDEAMEMGCDPDMCAYDGVDKPGPDARTMGKYRAGSGHIHIGGLANTSLEWKRRCVQWLDVLVGFQMASMDCQKNYENRLRRRYYGQAGRFRVKPYGLEYRTPSNSWVSGLMQTYGKIDVLRALQGIELAVDLTDMNADPADYVDMGTLREVIDATGHAENNWDHALAEWPYMNEEGLARARKLDV
jgi:hypothetical protein